MREEFKECPTTIRQYVERIFQSIMDRMEYTRNLCFLKNNKIGRNFKLGRLNCISDSQIGDFVEINNLNNIYGAKIGNGSKIGSLVEIQKGCVIGEKSVIQSHSFLCDGVTIGNNVFVSHGTMFINDLKPVPFNKEYKLEKTIVEDNVSIGTGSVIMCGITLKKGTIIGAGTVVLKNTFENSVVINNIKQEYLNK